MILKQGQIIDNKWNVVYPIKENPYAESYRVEDESGNPYFMKIYRLKNTPEKLIEQGDVKEIMWSLAIKHKNIISLVDNGGYSNEEGECRYMVANYFSGELLSEMLQREGKIDPSVATKIFIEMLEGLQYMHNMPGGCLHNDITPTNVMLSSKTGGTAELIDLGHVSQGFMGTPPFDLRSYRRVLHDAHGPSALGRGIQARNDAQREDQNRPEGPQRAGRNQCR